MERDTDTDTDTDGARRLFGGSFSIALPPQAIDVSDMRQIPDNQEVFVHKHTDQSLIVELLEYQSHVTDAEAAKFHFEEATQGNEGSGMAGAEVLEVQRVGHVSLQDCDSIWYLSGRQRVAKFDEQAKNVVHLHLGLFRLPLYTTDILITFNDAVTISPLSSSSAADGEGVDGAVGNAQPWTLEHFQTAIASLRLLNPSVFC
uniref:Ran guanine nucleotide release factor n=1 Tax=Callorhinchus milii TaxID=7868 RepID=V9LC74_CALMI